jgi:hypothetical protein
MMAKSIPEIVTPEVLKWELLKSLNQKQQTKITAGNKERLQSTKRAASKKCLAKIL